MLSTSQGHGGLLKRNVCNQTDRVEKHMNIEITQDPCQNVGTYWKYVVYGFRVFTIASKDNNYVCKGFEAYINNLENQETKVIRCVFVFCS